MRAIKWIVIIFGVIIVLFIIGVAVSPEGKESFNKGLEEGKQVVEKEATKVPEKVIEIEKEPTKVLKNNSDKEIYIYSKTIYRKYEQEAFDLNDANTNDSPEVKSNRLEDAEQRALRETAQKFNISEQEVADIISRLDE